PFTVWLATRVKSGPPAAYAGAGAAAGRCSGAAATGAGVTGAAVTGAGSIARALSAARTPPVTSTPPTKPANTRTIERPNRFPIVKLADVDATGGAIPRLGNRDGQDPVFQVGGHGSDVDRFRKREAAREAAVAALDAMVLLAGNSVGGSAVARAA